MVSDAFFWRYGSSKNEGKSLEALFPSTTRMKRRRKEYECLKMGELPGGGVHMNMEVKKTCHTHTFPPPH